MSDPLTDPAVRRTLAVLRHVDEVTSNVAMIKSRTFDPGPSQLQAAAHRLPSTMADSECIKETRQSRGAETPSANLVTKSMSYSTSAERTAAVVTALAELGVRPGERVLILLSDGPGFTEALVGTIEHQAVPLPVSPLLSAPEIAAAATEVGAQLLLGSPEQIHTLTDLGTEPPVLVNGAQGPWAAALRLSSVSNKPTRKQVVLLPHARTKPTKI